MLAPKLVAWFLLYWHTFGLSTSIHQIEGVPFHYHSINRTFSPVEQNKISPTVLSSIAISIFGLLRNTRAFLG